MVIVFVVFPDGTRVVFVAGSARRRALEDGAEKIFMDAEISDIFRGAKYRPKAMYFMGTSAANDGDYQKVRSAGLCNLICVMMHLHKS